MDEIVRLLEFYGNKTLLDQDGENLFIELNEGAGEGEIIRFEAQNGIELPKGLKELLLYSNGLNLFGLHIYSIDDFEFFPSSNMLSFHDWGNGDFDCISIGGDYPSGAVIFMSHSEDNIELVSNQLVLWFKGVISEMVELGTLLHPMDYTGEEPEGMYKNISSQID